MYVVEKNINQYHFEKKQILIISFISGPLDLRDDNSVIESVQNFLQPDIERRLVAKKRLDDLAVSSLLERVSNLQPDPRSSGFESSQASTSSQSSSRNDLK